MQSGGPSAADVRREDARSASDERGATGATGAADRPARPVTLDEQRDADQKAAFEEMRKKREGDNKRNEEFARMATEPNEAALKMWVVKPVNSGEPPFMFSNTADTFLVVAETAEYARRMARSLAGDDVWEDDQRTVVDEFKPRAPMLIARDFRG